MKTRVVMVAILMAFGLAVTTQSAMADGAGGPGSTSTACLYERYWVPSCPVPWMVTSAQEDADYAHQQPAPVVRHYEGAYRVRAHDTLWRIAVRAYGPSERAGHQWVRIARANHIHGTTIRVGQVLRIPR